MSKFYVLPLRSLVDGTQLMPEIFTSWREQWSLIKSCRTGEGPLRVKRTNNKEVI